MTALSSTAPPPPRPRPSPCSAGSTAAGAASDLWAFNIPAARWAPVVQAGAWPGPLLYPAGVMSGRHLYVYSGGAGTAAAAQMWRFVPTAAAPAPATSSYTFQDAGLAAGAAIGILLNIAILALTVVLWRRSGPLARQVTAASVGSAYEHLAPTEPL